MPLTAQSLRKVAHALTGLRVKLGVKGGQRAPCRELESCSMDRTSDAKLNREGGGVSKATVSH